MRCVGRESYCLLTFSQDSKTRKYTYTYDGLNRLTHAAYTGDGNYTTHYSYDKMGNIKTLQRYDVSLVDNLTYTYNGISLPKWKMLQAIPSGLLMVSPPPRSIVTIIMGI